MSGADGRVRVRVAQPADVEVINPLIRSAYAEARRRVADLPDVEAGVAESIAQDDVRVAEMDGKVLGVLILDVHPGYVKIANVAVDPAFGGRGIGRALMQCAENVARKAEVHELRLATHEKMPENVALYRHLGWEETGREGTRVFMSKRL